MDASKRLLILCSEGNVRITRFPERPRLMDNGVLHYFVEVTSKDGLQYGLQAFGEEAIALYKETRKLWERKFDQMKKICKFFIFPYRYLLLLVLEKQNLCSNVCW
jgi:hypothetical protein